MSLFLRWNCRAAQHLFAAEWDGEISDPTAQKLRAHLESCASCRVHYHRQAEAWRETRDALASHPRIVASADFNQRLWQRLNAERLLSPREKVQTFVSRPLPRLLASAFFGLAVALLFAAPPLFQSALPNTALASSSLSMALTSDDPLSVEYAIRERNAMALRFRAPAAWPLPQPYVEEKPQWQTKSPSNRKPNAAGPSASHFSPLSGSLC